MKSKITLTDPAALKLEELLVYLYGPTKIGKTTFCGELDNPLFIATEPGQKFLKKGTAVVDIHQWEHFITLLDDMEEVKNESGGFSVFVVDTVDNLYKMCYRWTLNELSIDAPRMNNFGADWTAIKEQWTVALDRLRACGKGIYFIGHSKINEEAGIPEVFPALSANGGALIKAMCDFEFVAMYVDEKKPKKLKSGKEIEVPVRVPYIVTRAIPGSTAGNRLGELPEKMDINFSKFKEEFYKAIKED